MSKFKKGDLVKIIADKTPQKSGGHLIGMVGTIIDVRADKGNHYWASDYKYIIEVAYQGETRRILANKDELELVEMLNAEHPKTTGNYRNGGPITFKEPEKGAEPVIPIGQTVEVDKYMANSQWYKAQGVIMAPPYSDGKYKVKLIKDGPNGRLRDLIGSTCLLTGLTKVQESRPSQPRVLPDGTTTIMFDPSAGAKKGVSHYAAGMPEGIEPMDIIRTQGWAKHFAYGNALKYLCRAPHKGTELVDVNKAIDYLKEVANIIEQESK